MSRHEHGSASRVKDAKQRRLLHNASHGCDRPEGPRPEGADAANREAERALNELLRKQ